YRLEGPSPASHPTIRSARQRRDPEAFSKGSRHAHAHGRGGGTRSLSSGRPKAGPSGEHDVMLEAGGGTPIQIVATLLSTFDDSADGAEATPYMPSGHACSISCGLSPGPSHSRTFRSRRCATDHSLFPRGGCRSSESHRAFPDRSTWVRAGSPISSPWQPRS